MASREETPIRPTPTSTAWRSKLGQTPGSSSRAKYHSRRRMEEIKSNSGVVSSHQISGTLTSSTSLAHEALLTNLNSALRALGGTPLHARSSNKFITSMEDESSSRVLSPIQPMQSLDEEISSPSVNSAGKVMKMQEKHSQLVEQCAALEAQLMKSENKCESLDKKLIQTDCEIQKLREEKKSVGIALKTLSNQYEERARDVQKLHSQYDQKESELLDLEERIGMATNTLHQLEESQVGSMNALERLKSSLKSRKKKITKLDSIIDEKKASINELTRRCTSLQEELTEASEKKNEVVRLALKARQDLDECEESAKRLECLSSEGYVLIEDQSRKATMAQKKWEEAEERLGEIESQLVEASARLEEKKAMIRDLENYCISDDAVENLGEDKNGIRSQVLLLRQLKETTATKVEESMRLTREIEQLRKEKVKLQQIDASSDDKLQSYCESLEKALGEATAEMEKWRTSNNDSNQICKVLRTKLAEKDIQLAQALKKLDQSNDALSLAADQLAHGCMVNNIEKENENIGHGTFNHSDPNTCPNLDQPSLAQKTDFPKPNTSKKENTATRLRRERYFAIQRIQEINGKGDQIRSSLNASIMAKMFDTRQSLYSSIRNIY